MRLAAWKNELHDEGAVHKDEWEEFYHYAKYLQQNRFWSQSGRSSSSKKRRINWEKFFAFMVRVCFTMTLIKCDDTAVCVNSQKLPVSTRRTEAKPTTSFEIKQESSIGFMIPRGGQRRLPSLRKCMRTVWSLCQ